MTKGLCAVFVPVAAVCSSLSFPLSLQCPVLCRWLMHGKSMMLFRILVHLQAMIHMRKPPCTCIVMICHFLKQQAFVTAMPDWSMVFTHPAGRLQNYPRWIMRPSCSCRSPDRYPPLMASLSQKLAAEVSFLCSQMSSNWSGRFPTTRDHSG